MATPQRINDKYLKILLASPAGLPHTALVENLYPDSALTRKVGPTLRKRNASAFAPAAAALLYSSSVSLSGSSVGSSNVSASQVSLEAFGNSVPLSASCDSFNSNPELSR